MWFQKKNLDTREYLELKKDLGALRIETQSLKLELDLILSKLKFKYKITKRDLKEEQSEDLNNSVLLPDNGMA